MIFVRQGKGGKDRLVMLPRAAVPSLKVQLAQSRALWAHDRARGIVGVCLPDSLAVKYPRAGESWTWHWVFPAPSLALDPRSLVWRKYHLHEHTVGRALSRAVRRAELDKKARVPTRLEPRLASLRGLETKGVAARRLRPGRSCSRTSPQRRWLPQ
jgi:integrase